MKTILLLLLITLFSNPAIAQTTAIPDTSFEQALIDLGLDATLDGQVLTANIDTVTYLDVQSLNINDLTGIESFYALIELWCGYNQLTSLDVSQNTTLNRLNCIFNQLTSLDVSQNTALTNLVCAVNDLTCLNIKNSNNINLNIFDATNNSTNLTCIEVDDVTWANANWTYLGNNIDPQTSFSTNCNNTCSFVGVDENSLSNLSIFPNPTTGIIIIDIGDVKQDVKVNLANSLGQVLLKQSYGSTDYISLELVCPMGLYFLTLETEGKIVSKKIIKQ